MSVHVQGLAELVVAGFPPLAANKSIEGEPAEINKLVTETEKPWPRGLCRSIVLHSLSSTKHL